MKQAYKGDNNKLAGAEECWEAIAAAKVDDPLTLERDGNLLRFIDAQGRLIGTLTSQSPAAKRLDAGETLLHCCLAWKYDACDRHPYGLASARITTGDPDDEHVKWNLRNNWGKPRVVRAPRSYAVNLVGESFHQATIRACRAGEPVTLFREIGNPHDARAIVVKTAAGATIGHIPRSDWLQRVVHDEGSGATATIKATFPGPPMAVVLDVMVTGEPLGDLTYSVPVEAPPPAKAWIERVLGR